MKDTDETDVMTILSEIAELIRATSRQALPILAEASAVMRANGWWVLETLTVRQYEAIVHAKGKLTPEALTDALVRFYTIDRINALAARWNTEPYKARRDVFAQVLWAHSHARYFLSTTVAVLQLEGVLREHSRDQHGICAYPFGTIRNELARRFMKLEQMPPDRPLDADDLRALNNYVNLAVFEKLFTSFDPTQESEPDLLNRHAIAHGVAIANGTQANSLRAILMLNTIHSLIEQLTP